MCGGRGDTVHMASREMIGYCRLVLQYPRQLPTASTSSPYDVHKGDTERKPSAGYGGVSAIRLLIMAALAVFVVLGLILGPSKDFHC